MKSAGRNSAPCAVVFDLDGTLVHSIPDLAAALGEILAEEGLATVPEDAAAMMMGDGVAKLVERGFAHVGKILSAAELTPLVERFVARYGARPTRLTKPYPDVIDTLQQLCDAGHRLAVCSNKHLSLTETILRELSMDGFFGAVLGGDSVPKRKPAPEPLLTALAQLGAPSENAVMVGDSHNDVAAARAADMMSIVVSYGYCREGAANLSADRVIDDFSDLPGVLRELS